MKRDHVDKKVDFSLLIPRSKPRTISDLKNYAELMTIPQKKDGLYEHQLRVARAAALTNTLLLMHHTGQGKTLAVLSAIDGRRKSVVRSSRAYIIGKENMRQTFLGEIQKIEDSDPRNLRSEIFYEFDTYALFGARLALLTDQEILNAYNDHCFVIDEVHNLYSFTKPDRSDIVVFDQFVRLRNLFPETTFIYVSATPMFSSADQLGLLAQLAIPDADKIEHGDAVRAIQENVAIFYRKIEEKTRYFSYGTEVTTMDQARELVGKSKSLNGYVLNGEVANEIKDIRILLEMSESQTRAYDQNYKTENFYSDAIDYSMSNYPALIRLLDSGNPLTLEKITDCSALFGFWLKTELNAIACGEWGVSAWYSELVDRGTWLFARILECFGWTRWDTSTRDVKGKKYIIISGKDKYTKEMQRVLNSAENVKGELIRTVIYSGAARDGFSFYNVLRLGKTPSWTESENLQALSRGMRIASYVNMMKLFDEFVCVPGHQKYLYENSIIPVVYDAISVPQSETDIVDIRIWELCRAKGKEIGPVFSQLVESAVDNFDENRKIDCSGNLAAYAMRDFQTNVAQTRDFNTFEICGGYMSSAAKKLLVDKSFRPVDERYALGPYARSSPYFYASLTVGMAYTPIRFSPQHRLETAVERIEMSTLIWPESHAASEKRYDILWSIIDEFFASGSLNDYKMILLAIFAKRWLVFEMDDRITVGLAMVKNHSTSLPALGLDVATFQESVNARTYEIETFKMLEMTKVHFKRNESDVLKGPVKGAYYSVDNNSAVYRYDGEKFVKSTIPVAAPQVDRLLLDPVSDSGIKDFVPGRSDLSCYRSWATQTVLDRFGTQGTIILR